MLYSAHPSHPRKELLDVRISMVDLCFSTSHFALWLGCLASGKDNGFL